MSKGEEVIQVEQNNTIEVNFSLLPLGLANKALQQKEKRKNVSDESWIEMHAKSAKDFID